MYTILAIIAVAILCIMLIIYNESNNNTSCFGELYDPELYKNGKDLTDNKL